MYIVLVVTVKKFIRLNQQQQIFGRSKSTSLGIGSCRLLCCSSGFPGLQQLILAKDAVTFTQERNEEGAKELVGLGGDEKLGGKDQLPVVSVGGKIWLRCGSLAVVKVNEKIATPHVHISTRLFSVHIVHVGWNQASGVGNGQLGECFWQNSLNKRRMN